MRILFIHNKYKFEGGEDTALAAEYELLRSKGHPVDLLLFDNDNIEGVGSKVKAGMSAFFNIASARKLNQRIKTFRPDVIHIHNLFFEASPSIIFEGVKEKIPIIMTIHNYRLMCANALFLRNNQVCELCSGYTYPIYGAKYKCYRNSSIESGLVTLVTGVHKTLHTWKSKVTYYIAVSDFLRSKLILSAANIPQHIIEVKPNFIDDLGVSTERKDYYLFVGRLTTEKGIDIVLNAFLSNLERKLVIAGDGPNKEMVLTKINGSKNIQYIGHQDKNEIIDLMKECQALIFPSIWYEGLPMTIIEAFSTGTPVIASNIGAMAEMIKDTINGYHFLTGDANDLNKVLFKFENMSSIEQVQMNKQARSSYLDLYHPEVHYQKIISIYQKAINEST